MYSFSDFSTVKELPDVMTACALSKAIGLSRSRTYELVEDRRVPYVKVSKRKIIFKEHLLQAIDGKRIFTDVAKLKAIKDLPEVFSPRALTSALHISTSFAYTIVQYPDFPAVFERNRIIVSKTGLIKWIREHQKNT